jgi:hypothetical protein
MTWRMMRARTITASGTPGTVPLPMKTNSFGKFDMTYPFVITIGNPP